ncbi:MAG TPA: GNAT family N-acetyltransferase [Oscillospiraceae bacterium]|nr:GNAT family N-acetyltransferase [Oscillospiraceae bacterium]HPF56621.1 GNAT family N-acetyltransferase [Clostridiales bacterium]HPK36508.1 GNAT family N-acetyltransferase [Oscillospiraceae bacterium]HPR75741.1 GNAT family N-acetyltransferase [Oscillospiraceae bacterium]
MKTVPLKKIKNIAPLFSWSDDKLIVSCLQGYSGQAFADDPDFPTTALIVNTGFSFVGGNPASIQAVELLECVPAGTELIPQPNWYDMVENILGPRARRRVRYGFKKDPSIFNREQLEKYAVNLPVSFYIKPIDSEIYDLLYSENWSRGLIENFPSKEAFLEKGFGFVVLFNGRPVSGASSYIVYDGGIEVEINTKPEYRRRGLASACGAQLILECLDRKLCPCWDAANLPSCLLAQKLGYQYTGEYTSYSIG